MSVKIKKDGRKAAGKSKAKKTKNRVKKRAAFALAPGFALWAVVWVISLFATFLLRSTASNIFFRFTCALPFVTLIYALIGKATVKAYITQGSLTVEKLKTAKYSFHICNGSILPYPFVEAAVMLPQANSVRCAERLVKLNLPPSVDCPVENGVTFRFRGTYEIGVTRFFVYDFFRMYRFRINADCIQKVYVLPRRLVMNADGLRKSSDSSEQTRKSQNSYEKIEVSDIRDYRPGDPIKAIHWKLSSKSESTIVREYNTGTTNLTYIFADMSARFPETAPDRGFEYLLRARDYANGKETDFEPDIDELKNAAAYEDMNEYCADGVVELTIAAVIKELNAGRRVNLSWYDSRSEIGVYSYEMASLHDFDTVFNTFATAPLAKKDKTVTDLVKTVSDAEDAKYIFILPAIDTETVASLSAHRLTAADSGSDENQAVVYTAEERYAYPALRAGFISECAAALAQSGLTLTKGSLEGFSVMDSGEEAQGNG